MTLAVESLPKPPAIEHYLFESPWFGVVALIVIGVSAFVVLNRRSKAARGGAVAGVCLLLAAAWWLAASTVTTTRELLIERSRALVVAAGAGDLDSAERYLGEELRVVGWRELIGRDALLSDLETEVRGRGGVESARIVESAAAIDGQNVARTQVRVRVETSQPVPPLSRWRLDWRLEAGEWRVVRLEWLDRPDWIGRSGPD